MTSHGQILGAKLNSVIDNEYGFGIGYKLGDTLGALFKSRISVLLKEVLNSKPGKYLWTQFWTGVIQIVFDLEMNFGWI